MLVASATTRGQHHRAVTSAQDAAEALRPLLGSQATDLFAIGLIVSALVALPMLMASTAYVIGAQFDWRRGLSEALGRAPGFYAVLGASIAVAVVTAGVSVFEMLIAASVIGGISAPIGLVILIRLARDPEVMGDRPISGPLAIAGWIVTTLVSRFGLLFVGGIAIGKFWPPNTRRRDWSAQGGWVRQSQKPRFGRAEDWKPTWIARSSPIIITIAARLAPAKQMNSLV